MAKGNKNLKNSKSGEKDSPKNKINNKRKNDRRDEAEPSSKKNKSYPVVNDERFQSVHYDPIFQNIPTKESKVEVDSRFDRMFTDASFGNRSRAKIDKRGRVKEKKESHLTRYYVEEKEKKKKGVIEEDGKIEDDERGSEEEEEETVKKEEEERVSKEVEETESEEEIERTELEESSSSDDDEYDYEEYEDEDTMKSDISQYLLANQGNVTTTNEETHRLAIVNLDWDNIKAADLYVVLSSCLPSGGQILSVSIYPTEFGLKCMEIEAAKGPSVLLNDNEDNNDESDSEDNSEDNEKLRSYELNKLSYYHGVAVFDSSTTANHVYEYLDGTEFLSTANVFDLRFIPDSMEFKHPPRDVATKEPASYSPPDFQTRALQHSDVKLTWEEDDPKRTKTLRRKFNPDELDELNEYLASSEDDSEHENDASEDEYENGKSSKKQKDGEKYRELLLSGNKSNSDEDEAGDMEVTFKPELEGINKRILEKKNRKPETVWEQLCQKNREKKKARRNRSKNAPSDEDSTDDDDDDDTRERENMEERDDFFMEDEPVNSVKINRKGREESSDSDEKEREATREELELLVAVDNNDNVKGYKVKRNNKKVKGKKGKMDEGESKLPEVDPSKDPRFAALGTSHLYALDPTDPQYKRTAVYARQQLDKKNKSKNPQVSSNVETEVNDDTKPIEKEKYELSSAIKSIKKNLKKIKKPTKRN